MSFQSDFELWKEKINAVKADEIIELRIPADELAADSETLAIEAAKDVEAFTAVGMDATLIEQLKPLAGALRFCQAEWMGEYRAQKEAQQKWSIESVKGYELQKHLLRNFTFAYRKLPNVMKKVRRIREGSGNADMVQDLLELGVLGQKYPDPLTDINFNLEVLDVSRSTSHSLSEILAIANGDSDGSSESKVLRDRAYTLLLNINREVREYARFIFWDNPDKKKKYVLS